MIIEIIHFYFYFGNSNGINQFNRYDFALERFARILWTLPVFNAVEILVERFRIGLAFHIAKQKRTCIINLIQEIKITFINSFEVEIFKHIGNGSFVSL